MSKDSSTHPYAIKTTSTALLSRAPSTGGNQHKHVFIPVPPSPTSEEKSPKKAQHHGHRYSRSLTDDGPMPLPALSPEGMPRKRRLKLRPKRAVTLVDDPKTWDSQRLFDHLHNALQNQEPNPIPERLALDIASFVRNKALSGRTFVHLTAIDLEGYVEAQLEPPE